MMMTMVLTVRTTVLIITFSALPFLLPVLFYITDCCYLLQGQTHTPQLQQYTIQHTPDFLHILFYRPWWPIILHLLPLTTITITIINHQSPRHITFTIGHAYCCLSFLPFHISLLLKWKQCHRNQHYQLNNQLSYLSTASFGCHMPAAWQPYTVSQLDHNSAIQQVNQPYTILPSFQLNQRNGCPHKRLSCHMPEAWQP